MPEESTNPILIVGADNTIGRSLIRYLDERPIQPIGTTRRKPAADLRYRHLDLAESPEHWELPSKLSAAILCAGLANLQQCDSDPAGTRNINVGAMVELARRLADRGAFLVFLSTNMVFDGSKPLRRPDEPVSPVTEYARQKAETEAALCGLSKRVGIVRLAKVFYRDLPLISQWREQLRVKKPIDAFSNLYCSPVHLQNAVEVISAIAERQMTGIWHLSSLETLSYAEIALELARCWNADPALIRSIPCAESIPVQRRPRWTSLDSSATRERLGIRIPSGLETVAACR